MEADAREEIHLLPETALQAERAEEKHPDFSLPLVSQSPPPPTPSPVSPTGSAQPEFRGHGGLGTQPQGAALCITELKEREKSKKGIQP